MRILLLGSTGMLGRSITREAKERGMEIFGVARKDADFNIDIMNDTDLNRVVNELSPSVIINAAALINLADCEQDPELAYRINARPVSVLAELSTKINANLVQISTDHFYQKQKLKKHKEDDPVTLLNEYAKSKYAGEVYALSTPRHLVLRTNIVGFRKKAGTPTFIEWIIESLEQKKTVYLFEDYYTSSIDVFHFSKALFDLIDSGTIGILNVASRDVSSKKKFIEHFARMFGLPLESAKVGSLHTDSKIMRADTLGLDVSKAEKLLGYHLPNLNEVIESLFCEYQGEQDVL